jgi:hypothetical protein
MSAICQIHCRICLKISANINLCLLYKYISYTAVFCAFYFDQDRKRDKRMCVLLHRLACIVNTWSHMQTRVHIFLSSRAVIFFCLYVNGCNYDGLPAKKYGPHFVSFICLLYFSINSEVCGLNCKVYSVRFCRSHCHCYFMFMDVLTNIRVVWHIRFSLVTWSMHHIAFPW